ncbi:UdgX family uracil-DNA binding protein [Leifsonia sp. SIMBA_070]|uniref:UdgX family uracil-DNA binding protein n=1 Tax=Leifsonia sp. SIMBA_070 TaxID=3085810 RepID=UPI003977FE8F
MADEERPGAEQYLPGERDLESLRAAAPGCRGCELYRDATQVVFSAGRAGTPLMLVGEQPGDREDVEGAPFVGPAGRILDQALADAGIDRGDVYVTNAVKHFRFRQQGKRRIHEKPAVGNIVACHPWLEAELAAVRPRVVVCLGATAGRSVLGRPVRIGQERGHVQEGSDGRGVLITTHPSALLRLRDDPGWDAAYDAFVSDLSAAARAAESASTPG